MDSARLPGTLWRNGAICVAPALAEAWRDELIARNLFEVASADDPPNLEIVGGETDDQTRLHFARRFVTSAARVSFSFLASSGTFHPVPENVLATLFDGTLAILDIPCGSGGGLLGLLSAVHELRAQKILPRNPVTVTICAGDISKLALEIHASMLARLAAQFDAVGIRLSARHVTWDVSDPLSTSELLDTWMNDTVACEEHLVFVSAFSGFAKQHRKDVEEAVRNVASRPHNKMLQFVWIEPDSNESRRTLPWVLETFLDIFRKRQARIAKYAQAQEYSWIHPLTNTSIRGKARLVAFEKSVLS